MSFPNRKDNEPASVYTYSYCMLCVRGGLYTYEVYSRLNALGGLVSLDVTIRKDLQNEKKGSLVLA